MTDEETATLRAKRDQVVAAIDKCLSIAAEDSVRSLAAIDEARKGLQSLWGRIYDYHLVTGARHRPRKWGENNG